MKTRINLIGTLLALAFALPLVATAAAKPNVWIYSDMSDKSLKGNEREGSVNDPDDLSAMAGYLLMANEFETIGIVVASTHRSQHRTTPNQGDWANSYFGAAYRAEVTNLNRHIGGYPADLKFVQSCIKESAERYDAKRTYASLEKYSTVQALLDAAKALPEGEILNVLCWGSLTEPAILVNHCLATGQAGVLKKLRFIAHWTNSSFRQGSKEHPEDVANCREDAAACAYLKEMAFAGKITYYECGAIGQHGIVSGSQKGTNYFDQFRVSRVGTIFVDGKFAHNSVDHSDAATYWTLLGNWGVSLKDIAPNGTNDPEVERRNEKAFLEWSPRIHNELLRRAKAAKATGTRSASSGAASAAEVQLDANWTPLLDAKFSKWELFMGVPHTSVTGLTPGTSQSDKPEEGKPLGLGNDPKKVFSMIEQDGQPVLRITGEIYGGLTSLDEYENFHFSAQVKWGEQQWPPRVGKQRDSGLLYHCTGPHGAFWNVWMRCVEFQVQEKDFGDLFMLAGTGGDVPALLVRTNPSPSEAKYVFDPSQPLVGTGRVQRSVNYEKPHGEWNTIEIYTLGRKAVHLVNGQVVMAIDNIRMPGRVSLSKGKIQIQSEGAEVYYRDIKVRSIADFPAGIWKQSGLKPPTTAASSN